MAFPWFDQNLTIDFVWTSTYDVVRQSPPLPSDYTPTVWLSKLKIEKVLITDNQSDITSTYLSAGYVSGVSYKGQKYTESGQDYYTSTPGIVLVAEDVSPPIPPVYPRLYSVSIPQSFIQEINNNPGVTAQGQGTMTLHCGFYLDRAFGSKAIIKNYLKQDGTVEEIVRNWLYVRATLPDPGSLVCDLEWEGQTISSDSTHHRFKVYHPPLTFTQVFHSSGSSSSRDFW